MSQMTFSDYEYSLRKRKTKREEWVEFVRPYYPNGKRGRPTKGIEKMLRMYLLQIYSTPQKYRILLKQVYNRVKR